MNPSKTQIRDIYRLAGLHGIQVGFLDGVRQRHSAPVETLVLLLNALGVPVKDSLENVRDLLMGYGADYWADFIQPFNVVWQGERPGVDILCPKAKKGDTIQCILTLENGELREWTSSWSKMGTSQRPDRKTDQGVVKRLKLGSQLPLGYHTLSIQVGKECFEGGIVCAPKRAYISPAVRSGKRLWGVFAPLYAVRSDTNWGAGDLSDLRHLLHWMDEIGGDIVGTLPLFASFMDGPLADPSPYQPASRLFWNELYADPTISEEWTACSKARKLASSDAFRHAVDKAKKPPLVDYDAVFRLKSKVLRELTHTFFSQGMDKTDSFNEFIRSNPLVEQYAQFRAMYQKTRDPWQQWPSGKPPGGAQTEVNYHLYVQYLMEQQLNDCHQRDSGEGSAVYLDFPLGVHSCGFDVFKEQDLFLRGFNVGAPPDAVFAHGQNWAFPPINPSQQRKSRYQYFIQCLRKIMNLSGIVRIDHVMGLHRLYCIPMGHDGHAGVYMRYPAEELYAVLTLESHRQRCMVVGEDLGTVPNYVRQGMGRHGLFRSYILWYNVGPQSYDPLNRIPSHCMASMNTHDMFPFAAYWDGEDVEMRRKLKRFPEEEYGKEKKTQFGSQRKLSQFLKGKKLLAPREKDAASAFKASLMWLSSSKAKMVLVELENLWGGRKPQNIPGTLKEHPNWRRKLAYAMKRFQGDKRILGVLDRVKELRERRRGSNR